MKTTSRFAIAAAASFLVGGFALTPAKAADLGGDCCADLEERVAELEATTVRKGNRKVSVTLYGWVNAGITWYDSGEESDAYVVDTDTAMSRIGVRGSGQIRPGLEAGYRLELGAHGDALSGTDVNDADDGGSSVFVRHASWYLKHDQLGTLTVGQTDGAATGVESIDLSGAASWISYNGAQDWNFSYGIFDTTSQTYSGFIWANVLDDFDAGRGSFIRYNSPTFAGFDFSASWGEDDRYDLALRYSNDWNGLSVAAGVAYFNTSDEACDAVSGVSGPVIAGECDFQSGPGGETDTFLASLSLYHASSGLFGVLSYGERDFNIVGLPNATNWYGKLGIRRNFTGHGETAIYGEYTHSEDVTAFTDADQWGVGVGQDIDAIGATMYLGYRHSSADLSFYGINADDHSQILAGMVVPF
ncbi:MAG: porin [Hyphomicrobiaceae bacterium]